MNHSPISPAEEPAAQVEYLNHPERLLERARYFVHGAPDGIELTLTISASKDVDTISIQIDDRATMEERCGLVDWFAKKLGARSGAGAPVLSESGYASYLTRAEFGANRKLYVDAYTRIAKASR